MPRTKPLSMNDIITNAYDGLDTDLSLKIYQDGDIFYVCKAATGSALASALWQVKKIDTSGDIRITWADGDTKFDNSATDLVTVSGLTFS